MTTQRRRYLSTLIAEHKLYPSRTGILHSVKEYDKTGEFMRLVTDCGMHIRVRDSRRGRASRWLERMLFRRTCHGCKIPRRVKVKKPSS